MLVVAESAAINQRKRVTFDDSYVPMQVCNQLLRIGKFVLQIINHFCSTTTCISVLLVTVHVHTQCSGMASFVYFSVMLETEHRRCIITYTLQ